MRKDMADVWSEPARSKNRTYKNEKASKKGRKTGKVDDPRFTDQLKRAPIFHSAGRFVFRTDKRHTLRPIRKFLRRHVGRLWDDVWSEICEANKDEKGLVFRQRILDWLMEEKTSLQDGELVGRNGRPAGFGNDFYVDPDGVLREEKPYERYRRSPRKSYIFKMKGQEYVRYDGVWFRVRMEIPKSQVERRYSFNSYYDAEYIFDTDCFIGTVSGYGYHAVERLHHLYGEPRVCKWKQQANSRECKKLNKLYAERFPES